MNRLVVRNTFLDIDAEVCDDGDSDCLETGDFARAATEPVSRTTGLSGASSSTDAVAGMRGPGGIPAQPQALPEEEPLYVFSNDRFQQPPQQQHARGFIHPGLQGGVPANWPPMPMSTSAATAAALAAMAGVPPSHAPPSGADGGRRAAEEKSGDANWSGDPLDVGVAAQAAGTISTGIAEQATLIAIRDMEVSVSLGDPSLADCPIIGCSDGFEKLTGYTRNEIIGQNCRFLNKGMRMSPELRGRLRDATMNGAEFIGVIPNMRKNGKRFQNLLHMTMLMVKGKHYVIGVQADASHISIDPRNAGHRAAIEAAAERIFAGNIDAWIQMQAREFSMRLSTPFSQLLKFGSPARFAEEQGTLVRIGPEVQASDPEVAGTSIFSRATTAGDDPPRAAGRARCTLSDGNKQLPPMGEAPISASRLGLKSIGSVKHPHDCVECCFHFFGPSGCRAAENCDFCHEFHPRKNAKKNRRLIKRLANTDGQPAQEAPSPPAQAESPQDFAASLQAMRPDSPPAEGRRGSDALGAPQARQGRAQVLPTQREEYAAASQRSGRTPSPREQSPEREPSEQQLPTSSSMMRLRYFSEALGEAPATLLCGIDTMLAPQLTFASEESQRGLRGCLTFVADPPLPAGLRLDSGSGAISGAPEAPHDAQTHLITVRTVARGPGGVALGEVPLTRCVLNLRVLSPSKLTLCSDLAVGTALGGDHNFVNLLFQAQGPP